MKSKLLLALAFFVLTGFFLGSFVMCLYCMNTESGREWMIRTLSKYHHIQVIK